jgi:magnesium-transporting ATPase (P-type)
MDMRKSIRNRYSFAVLRRSSIAVVERVLPVVTAACQDSGQVLADLGSSPRGLSYEEISRRLKYEVRNEIAQETPSPYICQFLLMFMVIAILDIMILYILHETTVGLMPLHFAYFSGLSRHYFVTT